MLLRLNTNILAEHYVSEFMLMIRTNKFHSKNLFSSASYPQLLLKATMWGKGAILSHILTKMSKYICEKL